MDGEDALDRALWMVEKDMLEGDHAPHRLDTLRLLLEAAIASGRLDTKRRVAAEKRLAR